MNLDEGSFVKRIAYRTIFYRELRVGESSMMMRGYFKLVVLIGQLRQIAVDRFRVAAGCFHLDGHVLDAEV